MIVKVSFSDLYATNQQVEEDIIDKLRDLIRNSKFIGGEELEKFENEFSDYTRTKFCSGCSNRTEALLIGLKSLDIGHGRYS